MENISVPVNTSIAKSGYLFRRSEIRHRWKHEWFVLYESGRLSNFADNNANEQLSFIHIPAENALLMQPHELASIEPAEGAQRSQLFGLSTRQRQLYLCAEDTDDAVAWTLALEEARAIQPHLQPQQVYQAPDGMHAHYPDAKQYAGKGSNGDACQIQQQLPPGSVIYLQQRGPPIAVDPMGNRIVLPEGQYSYPRYDPTSGMLMGMAMGSMMIWPWMMFPMFLW